MTTTTIGELARRLGVTARTIRYYEGEGLLSPRREGQRRLYDRRAQVRLKLILRGRRLGFSLDEIREILALYDAEPGEAGQLRFLIERIAARRRALRDKRRDIDATLAELESLETNCRARLAAMGGDRGQGFPGGPGGPGGEEQGRNS